MSQTVSLGDYIEIIGGGTPKTSNSDFWGGDIPWLSVVDFGGDRRWVGSAEKHITQLGLQGSSTKLLRRGDIIISARGTVGELAQLKMPMAFNQSCYGIRAREGVEQDFLYYLLKSSIADLQRQSHGGVFSTITRETFKRIRIEMPDLETQKKIADILGTIDEKIELNRRMNETLEQMGQALFRHYFIDNPEAEGWTDARLGDVVDNIKQPLKPGKGLGGRIYAPIDRLQMRSLSILDPLDYSQAKSSLIGFEGDDILVGAMRVYFHRVNIAPAKGVTRTTTFVLRAKKDYLRAFSTILLNQDATIAYASAHSKGSTMPYAIWRNGLEDMPIKLPPNVMLERFQGQLWPMLEIIRDSYKQIQTLTTLRETLLPRLISGKVRV